MVAPRGIYVLAVSGSDHRHGAPGPKPSFLGLMPSASRAARNGLLCEIGCPFANVSTRAIDNEVIEIDI